jgi:hypothetical protein
MLRSFFLQLIINYYYLGNDCGGEYSTHIWECNGLGSRAANIGPCIRGCCAPSGKSSFCCKDDACTGCSASDILKKPVKKPISQPGSPTTNTNVNPSNPTPTLTQTNTNSLSDDDVSSL